MPLMLTDQAGCSNKVGPDAKNNFHRDWEDGLLRLPINLLRTRVHTPGQHIQCY
jgi:hypothetical protein